MSYCEGSIKSFIYLSIEATEECHKVFPLPKQIKLKVNEALTLFWIRVCTHILPDCWQSAGSKRSRAWFLTTLHTSRRRFVTLMTFGSILHSCFVMLDVNEHKFQNIGENSILPIVPVYTSASAVPLSKLKSKARFFFFNCNWILIKNGEFQHSGGSVISF